MDHAGYSSRRPERSYLASGVEWDVVEIDDGSGNILDERKTFFVLESGFKFRANMKYTPAKFLAKLTELWGLRMGMKFKGNAWNFTNIGLIVEIGAGTF